VILFLPNLSHSAYVSDYNPVSHWDCDETSSVRYDSNTVTSNDLSDGNTVSYQTGVLNNACDFEVDNLEKLYISDGDQTQLDINTNDAITLSWWQKIESFPTDGRTFSKWNTTGSLWGYRVYQSATAFWFEWYDDGNVNRWCGWNHTGTTTIWEHVYMSVDAPNSDCKLYVNGVSKSVTSSTYGTSIKGNGVDFAVGHQTGSTLYFDGLLDEITFWDTEQPTTTMTALYNNGTPLEYSAVSTTTSSSTTSTSTSTFEDENILFMLAVIIFFLASLWFGHIMGLFRKV